MAFSVVEFEDLVRLLREHPEWRERLRPLILGERWEAVPDRLDRIEQLLEESVRRQAAFEERQAAFERRQEAFERRQEAFELELAKLVVVSQTTVARLERLEGRFGNLQGMVLESRYVDQAESWFTTWLDRPRVMSIQAFPEVLAARREGTLSEADYQRLLMVDLWVQGEDPSDPGHGVTTVVAEISATVNLEDVTRADQAATILRAYGQKVLPLAAGWRITDDAAALAERLGVTVHLTRQPNDTMV
ncbi:MAG: hypothetical protein IT303_07920 [Dehalococcoidia bacterium]|nr:hypothetical protein [Dehalococcoidia bacterium]